MNLAEKIIVLLTRDAWADSAPTAGELADRLGVSTSKVSAALRKLAADGKVRQAEGFDGSRTWTLALPW